VKLQIRLRSLLVVMGLLCVLLAVVAHYAQRARRQAYVIQRLAADGAVIGFEHEDGWEGEVIPDLTWYQELGVNWFGKEYFANVKMVILVVNKPLGEESLAQLGELRTLQWLGSVGKPLEVDNNGLRHLAHLRQLKIITLHTKNLTPLGVGHLSRCPGLELLDLSGTQFTDESVQALNPAQSLRWLTITGPVSDSLLKQLRERLPGCEIACDPMNK
jgi:hypothetical protein